MSDQFLFPCTCGNTIEVEASDAGKQIACSKCGKSSELPGLRELKKLEIKQAPKSETQSRSKAWTREKGILFAIGMGTLLLGLVSGGIFLWIGIVKYQPRKPKIEGDWQTVSDGLPPERTQVWAYAPNPGRSPNYQLAFWDVEEESWILAVFDTDSKNWAFLESSPRQPKDYFTKWGDSLQSGFEASVENSNLGDLWTFWYETDPKQPLPEWKEPSFIIVERYRDTYYTFAAICGGVALIGFGLVFFAVRK